MNIAQVVDVFNSGGLVVFPTDTVFGIGCRIDQPESVERIFKIKKRENNKPLPILVASIDMALTYLDKPNDIVRHLMVRYWPGGLTIIASCQKKLVYSPIRSKRNTIGIRMPDLPWLREVIAKLEVPIIGTSANISGKPAVVDSQDLDQQIAEQVDLVVKGKCSVGLSSTVVDGSGSEGVIQRQGSVVVNPNDLHNKQQYV